MKGKWTLLVFLCATFVVYTIDRALLGVLAIPIQRDTGMSDVQFGVLNSAVFWAYAAVVPIAGWLGDRYNRGMIIGIASIVWSLMTVLAGRACGFWSFLLLASVSITVPQTFYAPAAAGLIASCHRETRGVAMGLHQAAFYVGWMASGFSVATVLHLWDSWRAAYSLFGVVGFVLGCIFLFVTCRGEWNPQSEALRKKPGFVESFKVFFRCPSAVLASLGHVAFTFATFGYCAWGPKFVAKKFSVSPWAAGSGVMFCHFAAAFAAILVAGFLTDIVVRRHPGFRLMLQSAALVLAAPAFMFFGYSGSLMGAWCAAACIGIAKGAFEANSVNSVFDVIHPRFHASAMGYVNVLSGVIGSTAAVFLGWMSQHGGTHGLEVGFAVVGSVLAASSVLTLSSLIFTFTRDRKRGLGND